MLRLAFLLYAVIGTTLAGIAMVVVLTMGWLTFGAIIGAAAAGAAIAAPVAWFVAKAIYSGGGAAKG